MIITDEQIADACNNAYLKAGHNAYFGNGFQAGVEFALEKSKTPEILNETNKPTLPSDEDIEKFAEEAYNSAKLEFPVYEKYEFTVGYVSGATAMRNRLKDTHPKEIDNPDIKPSFWYMRERLSFIQMEGNSLSEIIEIALNLAKENPLGMVCSVTIVEGNKDLRKVADNCHVDKDGKVDLTKWQEDILKDDFIVEYFKRLKV